MRHRGAEAKSGPRSASGTTTPGKRTGKLVGYARNSPDECYGNEQIAALQVAGCDQIFQDNVAAPSVAPRDNFEAAVSTLHEGDTLVVWRLDRLGFSLSGMVQTMKDLSKRGIEFQALREGIDTRLPSGKLAFQIMGALLECERAWVRERTRAGMRAAQEQGKPLGRKPSLSARQRREVVEAVRRRGETIEEVARRFKVHSRTIRRVLSSQAEAEGQPPKSGA